jgi:hypothetical protein
MRTPTLGWFTHFLFGYLLTSSFGFIVGACGILFVALPYEFFALRKKAALDARSYELAMKIARETDFLTAKRENP